MPSPSGEDVEVHAGNLPYGASGSLRRNPQEVSWAYRLSGTTAFKTNADAQFSAAWSNTMQRATDYNYPEGWIRPKYRERSHRQSTTAPSRINAQPSYQAVQTLCRDDIPMLISRSPLSTNRMIYVNYSPSDVAGAAFLHITVTQPDGMTTTSTCSSSPCSITRRCPARPVSLDPSDLLHERRRSAGTDRGRSAHGSVVREDFLKAACQPTTGCRWARQGRQHPLPAGAGGAASWASMSSGP